MAEIESLAGDEPLTKHIQRHRTDRLIMLSDGIFAIATTLAALEIRLPEHALSLSALLAESGQSLGAYVFSFVFTAMFWLTSRELFARVARTDAWLTMFTLGTLCGIAIIPAAVHIFYAPGGLAVGFRFYSLVMVFCGVMNAARWPRSGAIAFQLAGSKSITARPDVGYFRVIRATAPSVPRATNCRASCSSVGLWPMTRMVCVAPA